MTEVVTEVTLGALRPAASNRQVVTAQDIERTGTFQTGWTKFIDTQIAVQIDGDATSVTATVLRAGINPYQNPNTTTGAPADSSGITGDPSTGIPPNLYTEPGVGWWAVDVTALSGGSINVTMSGIGGDH